MQPLVLAASPLTYAQYRKLSFADFRVRYTFFYVGLPILLLIPLLFGGVIVADAGLEAIDWESARFLGLAAAATVVIWLATLYSLRRSYNQSSALQNGIVYQLNEKGLAWDSGTPQLVSWPDIDKRAVSSGQWVLLRQASPTSKEVYFLNTAGILAPATRPDFYALLDHKRIKRV